MTDHYQQILDLCAPLPPLKTAVVHPVKANVLGAVVDAVTENLILPVLIGPRARIESAAAEAGIDIAAFEIVEAEHSHEAARKAAQMAAAGRVAAIMKGAIHTDELLGAVVRSDAGLRTEKRISHAFLMSIEDYPKPFIITDAAVNIMPDLAIKADILQNAINLWKVVFGFDQTPKAAILAAVETVNPRMQPTLDAAALCKMGDRGQITGAIIDGPLAFDNAISAAAARQKGIVSPVAGEADILLVPDIEAGNMLAKQLIFMGGADSAGIVMGARVPIMLTSRADNRRARLLSCALAVLVAGARARGDLK
ncbi:bifunctional enoyl-CoA hydratase/phosphate acetyltransferase [Oceaniglobus trochenteri]|uniref:bifunctional enoyl-CoA hydratase/phosphate acetyltransferase n=1 Tax=Oceaniglobus trochenteri TaxID=2763260 RepID=UPI001FD9C12E|nr:bifunctional enoyl-CoA hydratase/phosphate acetyltransferase [Oceaniglobus trochenteri]